MVIKKRPIKPNLDDMREFVGLNDREAVEPPVTPLAKTETPVEEKPVNEETVAAPPVETGKKIPKGTNKRANKEILTVGFAHSFIPHLNEAADILNINRTAFINLACSRLVRETYLQFLSEEERKAGREGR